MAEHYRPQLGGSWLVARAFERGPVQLYSGPNPRIVASQEFALQVPATLVRIQITAALSPGAATGTVLASIGPCWTIAPLIVATPPGVADPQTFQTFVMDWDFRLTDHVLVIDPDAVFVSGSLHVSGEALVTGAPLGRQAGLSSSDLQRLVGA